MSAQDAALETIKETANGAGMGAATAFTVTTVAAACPPVALALTAMSPVLLAAGGTGMIYEFFKILDDHKQQVKEYYASLTQRELQYLQDIENKLLYEHSKNLEFLNESKALNAEITQRPIESGVEGALKRYLESAAIAESLGATPIGNKLLPVFQKSLPSA
ncbi:MAG: hypothetical protein N3E45_04240 [Oscillatoriaceae bacterium SKW80]|nr:hypothetical protein [Oscillatoriaceae bacterium SKYG93]MCX8120028.1 hypothetical protein [Oscillatoriaceae bacterium SKW80]MDW8454032.1 hypothetical protein [Oscillatoriaceae cyanobacterium SKYGB_i_bin93]